jgi:hypothetical protein
MKAAMSEESRGGLTAMPRLLLLLLLLLAAAAAGRGSNASKCAFAASFPVCAINTTCSGSQVSSVHDRT